MTKKMKRPRLPVKPHDMSNDGSDGIKTAVAKSSSWKKEPVKIAKFVNKGDKAE